MIMINDTLYYKATRPDGTDFRTGTVDYADALTTGAPAVHPFSNEAVPNEAHTYLSVSTKPGETLIGGRWPCRLFRVEPIGVVLGDLDASPHKRATLSMRVVAELPAYLALGANGAEVAALLDQVTSATGAQIKQVDAARDAARDAAWDAAWDAARDAAWGAAWGAARDAAWDAARDAAWGAAWGAARDAVWAFVVRDLISETHFNTLAGPWLSVMGFPEVNL